MGATIRALRGHARLSQVALGERAGTHQNYLGAVERGEVHNPGLETLAHIACGLDVSIGVLAESYADPPANGALRVSATEWPHAGHDPACDAEALGHAIRLVRRARDLTQQQLAARASLHRSHLGSIEAGEKPNPGIATIARVARGLQHAAGEPPLLPLLARVFTGEMTVSDARATASSQPSGLPSAPTVPQASAGN